MPRIEDAPQGLGVGSLAEIPLLSKLTLAVLARVRSRSGFLEHANRSYPRISNQTHTLKAIGPGPGYVN